METSSLWCSRSVGPEGGTRITRKVGRYGDVGVAGTKGIGHSGRARSFKAFVDGGLAVEAAAKEVGLKNTTPAPVKPEPQQSPQDAV